METTYHKIRHFAILTLLLALPTVIYSMTPSSIAAGSPPWANQIRTLPTPEPIEEELTLRFSGPISELSFDIEIDQFPGIVPVDHPLAIPADNRYWVWYQDALFTTKEENWLRPINLPSFQSAEGQRVKRPQDNTLLLVFDPELELIQLHTAFAAKSPMAERRFLAHQVKWYSGTAIEGRTDVCPEIMKFFLSKSETHSHYDEGSLGYFEIRDNGKAVFSAINPNIAHSVNETTVFNCATDSKGKWILWFETVHP